MRQGSPGWLTPGVAGLIRQLEEGKSRLLSQSGEKCPASARVCHTESGLSRAQEHGRTIRSRITTSTDTAPSPQPN